MQCCAVLCYDQKPFADAPVRMSCCMQGDAVSHLPAGFILTAGAWSLQVIVSRMRTISSQLVETQAAPVRIVGLCTSLANAKDLGEWIGASSHGLYNFPPGRPSHTKLFCKGCGCCSDCSLVQMALFDRWSSGTCCSLTMPGAVMRYGCMI